MVLHVTFRLVSMRRLMKVCSYSQRRFRLGDTLVTLKTRTFVTASAYCKENEGGTPESSPPTTQVECRQALLPRTRRPLSPLERISSLLPQDALGPEVMQLREQTQWEGNKEAGDTEQGREELSEDDAEQHEDHPEPDAAEESPGSPTLPGQSLLAFGELLVAEYRKKRVEFRKMFQLQPGVRLQSSWGVVLHNDIAGKPAGRFHKTHREVRIFIRRASLDDYVLYMKRGPVITYPKDAATMLLMMDVMEGDCVLETGSGSGAMSLFLSRAVGSKGRVLSFEIREDHHKRAVKNYQRWRTSWSRQRGQEWPDNVQFHNADLRVASSLLATEGFNAIALDMINPQLVLPTIIPHLHPGAVCAVYLANITQVVDLLEGLRCSALPLLCERIIEVPIREWVVAPALRKDGQHCIRKVPILDKDLRLDDETSDTTDGEDLTTERELDPPAFGSIPYTARPHPEQMSHTAFLVKLRKWVQ